MSEAVAQHHVEVTCAIMLVLRTCVCVRERGREDVCVCETSEDCAGEGFDQCLGEWSCDAGACVVKPSTAVSCDAIPVEAVDTTGAGDTFTGFLVAGLDRGLSVEQSVLLATRASAIMVQRHGTSDVIPDLKDIEDEFGPQPT